MNTSIRLHDYVGLTQIQTRSLGNVCRIQTGDAMSKKKIAESPGPFPVINSGKEPLGHVNVFNSENEPIGIASRGSVGLVTWTPGRFFRGPLNYSCTPLNNSLDSRYLY